MWEISDDLNAVRKETDISLRSEISDLGIARVAELSERGHHTDALKCWARRLNAVTTPMQQCDDPM